MIFILANLQWKDKRDKHIKKTSHKITSQFLVLRDLKSTLLPSNKIQTYSTLIKWQKYVQMNKKHCSPQEIFHLLNWRYHYICRQGMQSINEKRRIDCSLIEHNSEYKAITAEYFCFPLLFFNPRVYYGWRVQCRDGKKSAKQ